MDNKYNQLVVMRGLLLNENFEEIKDFVEKVKEFFGARVKYENQFKTLPDSPNCLDTGGRNDVLFYVHDDDVSAFAIQRLKAGGDISWWEDYVNNSKSIIPYDIKRKYPKTW